MKIKLEENRERVPQWQLWFAWRPVQTANGYLVWLESVRRLERLRMYGRRQWQYYLKT